MQKGERVGHQVGGGQWGRSKGARRGERGSEPLGGHKDFAGREENRTHRTLHCME